MESLQHTHSIIMPVMIKVLRVRALGLLCDAVMNMW